MHLRMLHSGDAALFQTLRLRGLRECPAAFCSSYEEECDTPLSVIAGHLSPTADRMVFGAFEEPTELAGVLGLARETGVKLAHKSRIWGVYIAPEFRRRGIGRQLMNRALEHAFGPMEVLQVTLSVNASNGAALALYESAGFQPFGVEPAFLKVDGVLHDEVHLVRLRRAGDVPVERQEE